MTDARLATAAALERAHDAYRRGALGECESLCTRILAADPGHAEAMTLAGAARIGRGDADGALAYFTRAARANPRSAESFNNCGVALQRLGRLDEAERSFRKAMELAPTRVDAPYNLAVVHGARERWEEALAAYRKVVRMAPDHALAWNNLGNVLQKLRRPEEALECHRRAVALRPAMADAWNNCGTALSGLKRFAEALACYDEALRADPLHADASINRSSVLREMGDAEAALAAAEAALKTDPARPDALVNRALALEELGRFGDAMESYDRAIAVAPQHAEGAWNKGLLLLLRGDYEHGWPLYEYRWRTVELGPRMRQFPFPRWNGEDLAGKRILLHAEQGAGDAIQFARYIPRVQALGAEVAVETPAPLLALFASSFPSARMIEKGAGTGALDFHCALGSLALAFGTTLASIPWDGPYLRVDDERRTLWRERLGTATRMRIGLAWSGNAEHRNDHNRSIALAALAPILGLDAEFHSLQKDVRAADRPVAEAAPNLRLWGDQLHDFADTAALVECMDLVVSVDTAPVHVAGALGKPAWLLLPRKPDWRWLLERDDSPWYPSLRLFRQVRHGDWDEVIARVRGELVQWASGQPKRAIAD